MTDTRTAGSGASDCGVRSGSLFSGYGGLSMAVHQAFGTRTAWFCENDTAASKVLDHRWPSITNLGDITAVDWTQVEPVEVLEGGFPCQDISNAGRRAGIEGARSGLWSFYVDAIRVLRPRYVVVENVGALLVRGLDRVLSDLAALGFDAEWSTFQASNVGGCHKRDRVFIVATRDTTLLGRDDEPTTQQCGRSKGTPGRSGGSPADPESDGWNEGRPEPAGQFRRPDAPIGSGATIADPAGEGRPQYGTGCPVIGYGSSTVRPGEAELGGCGGSPADSFGARLAERSGIGCDAPAEFASAERGDRQVDWGIYAAAVQRWELILGRTAPMPTVTGSRGARKLSPRLVEWMMGLPDGHVTHVAGLSLNDQLKLLGNGVVPQQAGLAIRLLLDRITRNHRLEAAA